MKPIKHANTAWVVDALGLTLGQANHLPKGRLIYLTLRDWIRSGRLSAGQRLPSTRQMANELSLGRNTLMSSLDQLQSEGFLEARQGAGTFVCDLPFTRTLNTETNTQSPPPPTFSISARGQNTLAFCATLAEKTGAFAPGVPALDQFPRATWLRLLKHHQRRAPSNELGYQTQGGLLALREALAEYLTMSRSVRCHADQIIVVQGAQQGFELMARMLADPGDRVWMEEPGYGGAQACFQSSGLDLVAIPVDAEGLNPAHPATEDRPPRLIYLTPSHQYPSGVTMSMERRLATLELARQHSAWIIEDDYDSEFRYGQKPIPALQGLQPNAPVIYTGTFSKVLYPGLRLGYLVVPEPLVDPLRRANARLNREGQYPVQAALADLIQQGYFSRHIKRMRELYRKKQQCLRQALAPALDRGLSLSDGMAGMHLVAKLASLEQEKALVSDARNAGILLSPLSRYYLIPPGQPGLVLGYAGADEAEIQQAGQWLADRWLSYATETSP